MDNDYKVQYLNHHTKFIEQLKLIFPSQDTIEILNNLIQQSDDDKLTKGQLFTSSIYGDNVHVFIKNKIKLFSHKNTDTQLISESLFGTEFPIKNLLNNQPEDVKKIIWNNLHILCMSGELLKSPDEIDKNKLKILNQQINKSKNNSDKIKDILNADVNEHTTDMIDDIIESFEDILSDETSENPFGKIMEISKIISVKYADKIENGEIELDKIMKSIIKKIPGMEKMADGMMDSPLNDMMGSMMGGNKAPPKEKIIIDENFSTADIEIGLNKEKESKPFNIGGALKMADNFGIIPDKFGTNDGGEDNESDDGGMLGIGKMMELLQNPTNANGIPDINKILDLIGNKTESNPEINKIIEIVKKLNNVESQEDADGLKNEMNSFLQNEMGVDIDKIQSQFSDLIDDDDKD